MVQRIKQFEITPVLVTMPPLHAERHLDFVGKNEEGRQNILRFLGDAGMIYRFHEMYSNAVAQCAEKTNCILMDVRKRFLDKRNFQDLIGLDGVHLSQQGYRLYTQAFAEFIEERKKNPSQRVFV